MLEGPYKKEYMKTFKYPDSLDDISRGTVYQVKDIITGEWSNDKVVTTMCCSTQLYLDLLINRKGIRIVNDD